MCFQTGQSTPLSCAGLSLPLPPTISALSVSVKSHQSSLTHYYLQWQTPIFALIAFIFSGPLHSVLRYIHFLYFYEATFIIISLSFCPLFCRLPVNPFLHYPPPHHLPFPCKQSQLLVIILPLAFIKLNPIHSIITTSLHKNDFSQGWKKKSTLNVAVCLSSVLMWQLQEHWAAMWHPTLQCKQLWCGGYASCSVAVYKYGVSVVEYCRYVPPDTPGSRRLFHHAACDQKAAACTERAHT